MVRNSGKRCNEKVIQLILNHVYTKFLRLFYDILKEITLLNLNENRTSFLYPFSLLLICNEILMKNLKYFQVKP